MTSEFHEKNRKSFITKKKIIVVFISNIFYALKFNFWARKSAFEELYIFYLILQILPKNVYLTTVQQLICKSRQWWWWPKAQILTYLKGPKEPKLWQPPIVARTQPNSKRKYFFTNFCAFGKIKSLRRHENRLSDY